MSQSLTREGLRGVVDTIRATPAWPDQDTVAISTEFIERQLEHARRERRRWGETLFSPAGLRYLFPGLNAR
jgi:hypothetical protein